ncbi:MAG: hypothetical protein HY804_01595 [Nitrospinae bacterium]|nr:hypothetical protein [Nitrospinota bacterium]
MKRLELLYAFILAHPGRRIAGRKRLQKEVLLAQKKGFPSDYTYKAYFYGAYSEELFSDLKMIEQLNWISEVENKHVSPLFMTYEITATENGPRVTEGINADLIKMLAYATTPDLEIAATYVLFRENGLGHQEAIDALFRTKPEKMRTNQKNAMALLSNLGISFH